MLKPGSPGVGPRLLERVEQARGGKRLLRERHARKWVETEWLRRVGYVEIDDVPCPLLRYACDQPLNEITMRINEGQTASNREILTNERLEER